MLLTLKPKVVIGICVYNDWEFLGETIDSLFPFVDKIFIFEGAWKTSIDSGAKPRSDEKTYEVINSRLNDKVELVQLNADTETQQRHKILEYCREYGADYLWTVDADEIFPEIAIKNIQAEIEKLFNNNGPYGIKLCSYNFFDNLYQYYHGEYPRIYRITPAATVFCTNHVIWPDAGRNSDDYLVLNRDDCKFFHLSYLRKNVDLFHIKMKFLEKEFGNNLYLCGYGEKDGKYQIPIDFFETYSGDYPDVIKNHPYFKEWTTQN